MTNSYIQKVKCSSSSADVASCEFWYNDPKKVFPLCTVQLLVESLDLAVRRHSVEFGMSEFHGEEWLLCAQNLLKWKCEATEYEEDLHINIAVLPESRQE